MEEIKGLIYRIIFPNGKSYIGQTYKPIAQRKKQHKQRAFYKKENGELVRFFSLTTCWNDTNNTVYNQHGGTMSVTYVQETDYGRIWCALK